MPTALLAALLGALLGACSTGGGATTAAVDPTESPAVRASPAAEQPAAGICLETQGEIVSVALRLDVPDPRCAFITGAQRLAIVNDTGMEVVGSLGAQPFEIGPGETFTFEEPFEVFLAPGGVHYLTITSPNLGGPALWYRE